MKKEHIVIVFLVMLFVGFCYGCTDYAPPPDNSNQGSTQAIESSATESQQAIYEKNQPIPKLTYSLERANLIKRLLWLNAPDKIVYVALLSFDGKVLATYATHKVSSVNSMLTTTEQIIPSPFVHMYQDTIDYGHVVASPDIDGSYNSNGNGVFFFTTDNQYVEWNGLYIEESNPFTLTTPPTITKAT